MSSYPPPTFHTTKPHSARVWNYWLGGKDYFEIDREYGDKVIEIYPGIIEHARASRAFLSRVVTYLAGEMGIRQFLDIGTGLPVADNTHEVAQAIAPECRVVYVDNDPLVLAHARALLVGTPEGATAYIDVDLHEPQKIVDSAAATLDFRRPIALMLLGAMGNVADTDEAYAIMSLLRDALPAGSYLTVSDGSGPRDEAKAETLRRLNNEEGYGYHARSPDQIARFFDGLELVEPGVVSVSQWRPDPRDGQPPVVGQFGGVARKL